MLKSKELKLLLTTSTCHNHKVTVRNKECKLTVGCGTESVQGTIPERTKTCGVNNRHFLVLCLEALFGQWQWEVESRVWQSH